MMIKAVIVDLDDTLFLTEAACFAMENDILQQMGRPPMDRTIHTATWGKPLFGEAILLRSPGVDVEEFKKRYVDTSKRYIESGSLDALSPENLATLDHLIEMGKSVIVLTSRTHEELHHLLEPDHLLAERVKAFYYHDNTQFHKPDPRVFDELLRDHQVAPDQCVYIGDAVSDSVAAKEAGIHFIACLENKLRTRTDFAHLPVDAFVDSFADIVSAVRTLDARPA